jgi:hypothetical protein
MKKLMVLLAVVSLVVISGCYRPSWHRANTTYAELEWDSEDCKRQINIGSTRPEKIDQYEKCMKERGYQLKGKDSPGTVTVKQKKAPTTIYKDTNTIEIDKDTKVYVGIYGSGSVTGSMTPAYKYFHKKDCKHLWNFSVKEMTAGEAIASGKTICPDCFRD